MDFRLTEEHLAIRDMAHGSCRPTFCAERGALGPRRKFSPAKELRMAAGLGLAGIYVSEDVGGSGLGRAERDDRFRGAGRGPAPSTAAYLSIHNMVAWIDRPVRRARA